MRRAVILLVVALALVSIAPAEAPGDSPVSAEAPGIETAALPLDSGANTCYIPVDDATRFPLALADGWQAVSPDADGAGGCVVERASGDAAQPMGVVLTRLPVLCIDTPSGGLPDEDDMPGRIRIYEADRRGGVRCTETPMEINLRGNTSKRFPKKSYRVQLVDEAGGKRKLSIAGLRSDDDWILNPMYSDTSKIREAISYWLWDEINSCGQAAASSAVAYAEVLVNGEYYGLSGVQERVNRKQVGADRQAGILYKVTANDWPTPEELRACESDEACRGIELAFAGAAVRDPWAPAADHMAFLSGEAAPGTARPCADNAVDYMLWSVLVQARDGHFKNQFIHCVPGIGGYTLYRMLSIIKDILRLSKAERGPEGQSDRRAVAPIAAEVRQALMPRAAKKGIDLQIDGDAVIRTGEQDVWEILYNLMDNAVRYGRQGGYVRVSLSEGRIAVEDDGIGIDEAHIGHIFEQFYRVDDARDAEAGGTGLGLSIVRAIVERCGGRIRAESEPGAGARFIIEFDAES